jgi:GntP family gluconate:H+ symporter
MASLWQILISLVLAIVLISVLTARFRLHPFFVLLLAAFLVGIGVQMPPLQILSVLKDGFGSIMKSLGFIIVLGTTLGLILEKTGSTTTMAHFILRRTGEKKAPLAMMLSGFVVGLPVFCDSGFIVLSGLNQSLSRRARVPLAVMSVSLASGLYSVHCLIPPHPGATAAAVTMGAELGKLIGYGLVIALPTAAVGYWWAKWSGRNELSPVMAEEQVPNEKRPSVPMAFLPVVVPVFLIALRSFLSLEEAVLGWQTALSFLGEPVIALTIGILLAALPLFSQKDRSIAPFLREAVEKAGSILVIIGAGGAFGAVLAATNLGTHFVHLPLANLGLMFPFLLTVVLKTAQGSSTVAIITAASIVKPLLPALGLLGPDGALLSVLSMGAGSMMISHSNDAYFWVISQFSGLDIRTMLRCYTVASMLMGVTAFLLVCLLSWILV